MVPNPIVDLIHLVLNIYLFFVFAWVILSWLVAFEVVNLRNRYAYMVSDALYRITEPALARIRRRMPDTGRIDLSPLVLILLIYFAKWSVTWIYVKLFL